MKSQKLATVKQIEARKMKQKTENLDTWQSLYPRLIVRIQSSTNFYYFFVICLFFCNNTIEYLGYITYSHLTYKKRYSTYNTLLTVTYLQYALQYLQYITYNSLITVHVTKQLNTKQIVVN